MEIVRKIVRMRALVDELRRQRRPIGFVPTMGGLHAGHLSLVRLARERGAEVIVSVFVNPLQFGEGEDFEYYPRDLTADCELLVKEGVKYVFAPEVEEMYPTGSCTHVEVTGLSDKLTGEHRPGHFRGVTTVVLKLLNIVEPDFAVFGWKDAQQLVIIQRMVRDLSLDVEIVPAATVRESDGVAFSTRNQLLDEPARKAARSIHRSLQAAMKAIDGGERVPREVEAVARKVLEEEELVEIDHVKVVDGRTLEEPKRITGVILILVSVKVAIEGRPPVLLIDNARVALEGMGS